MDSGQTNIILMCIYRALYNSADFEEDFSIEFPEIFAILKQGRCGALSDDQCEMMWNYYQKWRDAFAFV